jgi:hypothetical protein
MLKKANQATEAQREFRSEIIRNANKHVLSLFSNGSLCLRVSVAKTSFSAACLLLVRRQTHRRAALLKSALQFLGDLLRPLTFDLMALHHVDELAIFQESD